MAKKRKSQVQQPQDDSKVFMQRLQKNLEFFKKRRPEIYRLLASMELQRVELVVTPGKDDVDMMANGKSCYHGLAREYSLEEVERVLSENPESKRIRTFSPPWVASYQKENFADQILRNIVEKSPVKPSNFKGYIRGNVFPSMVFLGCGLGYHIDALTKKASIINGIIIEREPEKFAVSLYTVDWEEICSRFSRKGFSLTFAVGKADQPEQIRRLVSQYMNRDVPFYPFFSTYYNHLADVDLAKAVMENAKDLAVVAANWSNYDNELMRLSNTAHNIRRGGRYLPRPDSLVQSKPLVVVGSGPSLDKRVEILKKVRDQVVVVSAGTALRPLLAHGVKPDYHVELDPSYLIYQLLSDVGGDKIRDIPLLAVNEVNPFVPTLFDKVFYYFKADNTQPALLGLSHQSFANCNPTVTNAALSIGYSLGFRTIYLFGTDYGFEDADKDHSSKSVYGDDTDSAIAQEIQKRVQSVVNKRRVFKTPSVDGGTVLTRNDYYSAKRSVEELIYRLKTSGAPPEIFNCADGALIEGASWLQEHEFLDRFVECNTDTFFDALQTFESLSKSLDTSTFDTALVEVQKDLERESWHFTKMIKTARLKGRRDLCTLVNDFREQQSSVRPLRGKREVSGAQLMTHQLLKGSLQHFLYVGICHGMACEDGEDLERFMGVWEKGFLEFLATVPTHYARVMIEQRILEGDPWARRFIGDRDPEFLGKEGFVGVKQD
ncbi:6-hydroxymethylpterin diphosphokinase MptE-like protein [Marinobacter sp. DY40_1A1]|uniref:motility associated factor glycosyltransferase family protein n=1 Tax=Marinobacter sp. DY40_1A1 TaxID=2583229 RepID=UPI001908202B|nr:6-hydroxymethylpterin diphosphokinase MptE-like protein [Marinobacter sp. DY40_1A1]MBK1885462.1 motility associated factor glycosyltransferase family protein [Marinobacter sp. DY40_1A1]